MLYPFFVKESLIIFNEAGDLITMNSNLLEIMACPSCKGELLYDRTAQELICNFDHLAWPIVDGVPVMLKERARKVEDEE